MSRKVQVESVSTEGVRVLREAEVLCGYRAYPEDVAVMFADFHVERVPWSTVSEPRGGRAGA